MPNHYNISVILNLFQYLILSIVMLNLFQHLILCKSTIVTLSLSKCFALFAVKLCHTEPVEKLCKPCVEPLRSLRLNYVTLSLSKCFANLALSP